MLRYCRELLAGGRGKAQREAYVSLCDLLVVFGRQLRACGLLAALVSSPDPAMQQALQVRGGQWGEGGGGGLCSVRSHSAGLCAGGGDRGSGRGGG